MKRSLAAFICVLLLTGLSYAADDMALFEKKAKYAKELGATFMSVSDDVPPGLWQFEPKDDPYPAWFVYRPNMLKVFPPKDLQPFVNMPYAEKVAKLLEDRCKILRKYGLKASFTSNEPQTLPEAFFVAYPELRGPRVDQPNRSRVAWWAPSVDEPKMLELYAESIKLMLARCPEIESFTFPTSDAGAGFDWVPALYAGLNGNAKWKDRPMEQRISGFLINLQKAAKDAGHDITISVNPIGPRQWMTPSFSPELLDRIVKALPRGLAVSGREGPDGRPFGGGAGGGGGGGAFSPVVGIVVPPMGGAGGGRGGGRGGRGARGGDQPAAAEASYAPRIMVNLGDETVVDFNYRLTKATRGQRGNQIARVQALRDFAVTEVGEENADALLDVWSSLNQADENLNALNFGAMLRFGHVLNRWVTRPMVPFPQELTDAEKKDWKPFLFQAKGDEQAYDLIDIQAMRMYESWGAKLLFQRVIETTAPQVLTASQRIARMAPTIKDESIRKYWELYAIRLEAAYCLLESADHMVSYQAHLDRVHALGIKPEVNPPLGVGSDWARTDMMELARKEIDTMIRLRQIIMSTKAPVLETADSADEETAMRLNPNIAAQIKDKIDTMNRKWRDYDRIFTIPNL